LFSGSPAKFSFLYRDAAAIWFRGRTSDASVDQKVFRDAGTWQVSLRGSVGNESSQYKLVFEWHDIGRAPNPQVISQPKPKTVSTAPPPPTMLDGRGGSHTATHDPDEKDQAFADVLTERYSIGLHGIMNWGRLSKGQEFTELDAREWNEMERKWTDEVRELLRAHGCNPQIQAHFRDLHEVPYNQFHHFRYMSEKLSMFSLRLKRLKSIINHYANVPILD
jgi:hypothetical protein